MVVGFRLSRANACNFRPSGVFHKSARIWAGVSCQFTFDPPDNDNESGLCELDFPAFVAAGFDPPGGFSGPWHATTKSNPAGVAAIGFGDEREGCNPA